MRQKTEIPRNNCCQFRSPKNWDFSSKIEFEANSQLSKISIAYMSQNYETDDTDAPRRRWTFENLFLLFFSGSGKTFSFLLFSSRFKSNSAKTKKC